MSVKNSSLEYLSKTLLSFNKNAKDAWSVDDAVKGVSIIGGTGSGKTSASGELLAKKFLEEGWGGLVLCAKSDEAGLWEEYCKATNRTKDLLVIKRGATINIDGKDENIVFNPIDYEMRRSGIGAGETQNITNIFMNIYRIGNRISGEGQPHEERFWDAALKRCLNRVIELLKLAKEDLSYVNMVRVISTCDGITTETITEHLVFLDKYPDSKKLEDKKTYCLKCLVQAFKNVNENEVINKQESYSYDLVEDYFTHTLPGLGERTKGTICESFMGLAEPFLNGMLSEHFAGKTNIFPETIYTDSKIIVLDFSIKEFLDAGVIAQSICKLMFQQAMERRNTDNFPMPVFLWCDEAHYFINSYDQIFLTTARSSRTATVFLSQNIPNYLAVMGSGSEAKAKVDSLMGNLCTKIFHANSDAETNEYASRLIGSNLQELQTSGQQQSLLSFNETYSQGLNSQYLPQVQPREFTTLKTGGKRNDRIVHAIIAVSGRAWENKRNYIEVSFKQLDEETPAQ